MKNFNSRNADLKIKFNRHLQRLTKTDNDFYQALANEDILELKTVLSDINNLLTYRLTLIAGNWISDYFNFTDIERTSIIDQIDSIKPNAQGYDIKIEHPIKIIGEVKCNIPVKGGSKFGSMQRNKLIEDAQKLLNGKRQIKDTSEYLKFLFIIDVGDRSAEAVINLTKKTRIRVENDERIGSNITRENMIILTDEASEVLVTNKVYLKTLNLY